jgi:hypothetical protein
MTGDSQRGASEGHVALAELERLQRAIEESRKRRRAANDAYDSFMRSFDAPPDRRVEPPAEERSAPAESTAWPAEIDCPPRPLPAEAPASLQHDESSLGEFPEEETPIVPAAFIARPAPERRSRAGVAAVIAAVVVLAVAVIGWRVLSSRSSASSPESGAAAPVASPVPQPASASPPPAAASVAAEQPRPPRAELTTVRRVWVRVMVDGERTIERELDANVRVPLSPKDRIVVRTGDAGALRVALDGKDQGPLGRDGEVVTRAFPLSPPPVR